MNTKVIEPKYIIRLATIQDNEMLAKLSVITWQQSYKNILDESYLDSLDWQERFIGRKKYLTKETNLSFVAEIDGRIIGFCDFGPARATDEIKVIDESFAEIYAIYVDEGFQKQGIGRALFTKVIEYFKSLKVNHMIIWTLIENIHAMKFYVSLGGIDKRWLKTIVINGKEYQEVAYYFDII